MKKLFCLLSLLLLLAACGAKPAPVWIAAGHKQLETFKQGFLTGSEPRITEIHFRNAVEEIKKGGDADRLGKAWLTRMAVQIAVLKEPDAGDYPKIEAAEAVPANRNFYRFLKGDAVAVDILLLPESYRPFWVTLRNGDTAKAAAAITAIDDPLSRLIASGLAVRQGLETEAILRTAVETASQNGWKRALLAWLERLKSFHEAAGDAEGASAICSRIDLMK
jgi:hypothetical protein